MKIGQVIITMAVTGITIMGMGGMDFSDIDSVALIKTKIKIKTEERKKLFNSNPCVVFAEEDNVGMNVKTLMKRDQYHRSSLTEINRTFYCPIHKKSERCITPRGEAWKWCKKGQFHYTKWDNLRRKAVESEEIVKKIKGIDETLEALEARLEELKVIEKERKKSDSDDL